MHAQDEKCRVDILATSIGRFSQGATPALATFAFLVDVALAVRPLGGSLTLPRCRDNFLFAMQTAFACCAWIGQTAAHVERRCYQR